MRDLLNVNLFISRLFNQKQKLLSEILFYVDPYLLLAVLPQNRLDLKSWYLTVVTTSSTSWSMFLTVFENNVSSGVTKRGILARPGDKKEVTTNKELIKITGKILI